MITYSLDVVMGNNNPKKRIVVKRHDTGICVNVIFKKEIKGKYLTTEETYTPPAGSTAVIKIAKPDNTFVIKDGKLQNCEAFFELPSQSFTDTGTAEAEVSIYDKDGLRVTSGTFYFDVLKECTDGCSENSQPYFEVLGEYIKTLNEAMQVIKEGYKPGGDEGDTGNTGGGDIVPLLEGTIEEITIPNEVTNLAKGVFGGCSVLEEINADESHKFYASADGILYTKDGKKLVSYPAAREETEYIMPDSVEEVESMAFNNTTRLEKVILSDNIKSLPENLAIENKNADIVVPSNIKNIRGAAFFSCYGLVRAEMQEGVETIEYNAFACCDNLADVYIPRSVTSIDTTAFDASSINVEGGLTIHGYAGSYAETYANENGFNFEVIEE